MAHSDVPVYASPGICFLSDTVAPRHQLALAHGQPCEILMIFKAAERDSGGNGAYMDPMLRKSYKELPPLP